MYLIYQNVNYSYDLPAENIDGSRGKARAVGDTAQGQYSVQLYCHQVDISVSASHPFILTTRDNVPKMIWIMFNFIRA